MPVAGNDGIPERSGNITVTSISGKYKKTIEIKQEGAKLYLLPAKDTVSQAGEVLQVKVVAQGDWTLEFFSNDLVLIPPAT